MNNVRFVGLDVHAETIAVAVAEVNGEVRSLGIFPNRPESVRRLIGKLGRPASLRVCYEAGPTGYVLYWQLSELGVACEVVAPTLVPVKAGDRVKTARRDQLRARHRLSKFLLRHGRRPPEAVGAWTLKHLEWIRSKVRFEESAQAATLLDYLHEVEHMTARITRLEQAIDTTLPALPATMRAVIDGLQSLRGVAKVSAVTLIAELGQLSRFAHPRQLMGYAGIVSREHSSGERIRRGAISKTGNAHLRRIVVEAAWSYRHRPAVGAILAARQKNAPAAVTAVAWKAQHRLHARYVRLMGRGKSKQQTVTAVGRELLGFIWAIGVEIEQRSATPMRRAA
jgi:transposase